MVTSNLRLCKPLAQGGMASVWVADDLDASSQVAVKFISSELIQKDPAIVERFKREASLAAKLRSPHVVQVFEHGLMADGTPYIAMELLEGESLTERLRRAGVLSLGQTAQVVTQVARALGRGHELGIVHRDLMPGNLFVVDEGDAGSAGDREREELFVKVLDFGIAKQQRAVLGAAGETELTRTGEMLGTPHYMSPEQIRGEKDVDFRADVWALGVVAYRCITGRLPFTGNTIGAICIAIANADYQPPS